MDTASFSSYFEPIRNFFTVDNWIPWSMKFTDTGASNDESETGRAFNLSFQMVTSKKQEVIQREINILESCLNNDRRDLQREQILYLLALGYYKTNDYAMSVRLLHECLLIAPEWEKALSLLLIVEERIVKHGVVGMCITAACAGLFLGGLTAMLKKKN